MLLERNVFPNKSDFNSSEKVWVDFKELNSFLLGLRFPPSALWVKSGNRGNLKCLKVNNHFALIFHPKIFISFLSDTKLPKVYD